MLIEKLSEYKNNAPSKRSCPKIDKKRSTASNILYCGSIKKELHGRLAQHLGFGSPNTYGLQLVHWAEDLKLKFHHAYLSQEEAHLTELIESALALEMLPLVGKFA